ncbi:MAG: SIS domain-containing protein [Candidatus Competibacterales bacterium]|nr:SIS domain-containing protein [Candidatus Competibacterales bacterium]
MLGRIREQSGLRPSERRVAEAVLADPEAAVSSSIAALAERVGVSEPTVLRFCRALGCRGFQDFKLQLARDLALRLRYATLELSGDEPPGLIADKAIDGTIAGLERLRYSLDSSSLEQAIERLGAARRIECYGLGGAGLVAADAQLKFARLGLAATAYADAHLHNVAASLLEPDDVVLAISNSGRSRDLLRSVCLARRTGAGVIAVTATDSPLAGQADLVLAVDSGARDDPYAPIRSRIEPLVVIDTLALGVALRRGRETLRRLATLGEVLAERFVD